MEESEAAASPGLHVSGLREEAGAPRGKSLVKSSRVKFICKTQYHIKCLGGFYRLTTATAPGTVRALSEDKEKLCTKITTEEERGNLGRKSSTRGSPSSDSWDATWVIGEKNSKEEEEEENVAINRNKNACGDWQTTKLHSHHLGSLFAVWLSSL